MQKNFENSKIKFFKDKKTFSEKKANKNRRKKILKQIAKRGLSGLLVAIMLVTSLPLQSLAAVKNPNYDNLTKDKSEIINDKDVTPAMLGKNQTAEGLIKNPDQPAIYTLRTDYKVQNGDKYRINYQPYIASVGDDEYTYINEKGEKKKVMTLEEKAKVDKIITLPDLAGYEKPNDDYKIDYDTVKKEGVNGSKDFRYKAKSNTIQIKHIFQDLEDFTKYTNPDGSVGEEGQLITTQNGNTGSSMEVSPLDEKHPNRKGFVPEAPQITMQVPENAENFILEYRYNRAHYDVVFDSQGGTPLPSRTLYYEQTIPKIDENSIPTKIGCEFLGWKTSVGLTTDDNRTFKAGEIIKDGNGEPIKDLNAEIKMPAQNITFTAQWKDKEKADYAIQFWVEKADHDDNASLLEKYDYMGTRVYEQKDAGTRPDLNKEPVNGLKFPDLDDTRLQKIWNGDKFNRSKDLYLNKFYVYNQALTHDQNKDSKNANLVKSVDATGKTVYNIYYDRQVYDLYFTKSNQLPEGNTFYPEIWEYDEAQGKSVMKGGPGNLYHYKARFNEMMYKWPNDAKQTKGFTPGYQSFGWGPNYSVPNWPLHLDTPPYRLNAEEFLDMGNYTNWSGYTKKIDKGDGTSMDLDGFDFTTLSFGIKQDKPSIPHHMDFWMDGFKDGETIIRYDLVRTKADTADLGYDHRYPRVQGFTPYGYEPNNPKKGWPVIREENENNGRVTEADIGNINDDRDDITPNNSGTYYDNYGIKLPIGQLDFIPVFFSDADEYGDPLDGEKSAFKTNGYLRYKYTRNKYPLRFNYDPSIIRDDSYFKSTNQLDTFYEFPLKVLSPDLVDSNLDREDREYFKEDPKNLLDNPENLQKLGLTDLVFTDPQDGKLKVKRPEDLSDQMVFKGWALDPAGTKLIWENKDETMPTHPVNLYAKWGEPDYKWKVTFDPDGGKLRNINEENLTKERKIIQEGDIGQEEVNTYAKKEKNDGDKQVFTVIQRQKLVEPNFKPVKKGYDFMGWEVIRYKKDAKGDYTDEIDDSYRKTYKVPELYSFGNDVVSPVYLKAIWVPNQRVDVKIEHYMLDKNYNYVKTQEDKLEDKRSGYLVATTGDKQDDEYILASHDELEEKLTGDLKTEYDEYNKRVNNLNNSFFQTFRVEPKEIPDPNDSTKMIDNPKFDDNVFKFFYRPFRQREYKVNYIDEKFKGKETEKGAAILEQELVTNGNRHYDARNYRPIPGWVLTSAPQQQLFFDVNEETNEFIGINGTGKDEITFYYKDVRVIEVPENGKTPEGYVRVTFKADKGGSFGKDAQGNDIKELHYDVIKGLKSDFLPVPKELAEGETADADKYYITPETGKKFTKWDDSPLLNDNTIINEGHTFTAYFEWSGLLASGLVRTEAFKDPKETWTNDFAPTIEDLNKKLVWKEKDVEKPLPAGTVIKLYDEAGKELTSDEDIFKLVNEQNKADKDQLVRTVNITAKVTFTDGKEPQELTIPIKVYKNIYEALNKKGDKPLFLTEAEGKDAKDGGLKDVTGDYVMVTIKASKDFNAKDDKIYYVNKNAWVEIPEVKTEGSSTFVNWTSDKAAQNEGQVENGIFDFGKRHKFTEDTIISPKDAKDVVEQKQGEDKPKVPDSFVKVIVKTTDNATDESKFEKTFWVNPTTEVNIDVVNPTGKTVAAAPKVGAVGYTMNFSKWESEDKARTWTDKIVGKFENETTIVAKYSVTLEEIKPIVPTTDTVHTPQGKTPTADEIKTKITPPEGKTIKTVTIVENPDVNNPGESKVKVIVEYTDGSSVGTNEKPVEVPVEVHKNIIPEAPGGQRPKDAMDNYVKVIFKAGTGGSVSGDLVYYVSPEVEVDMTESAKAVTKTPDIGYFVNGENWTNTANKALKGTFTDAETEFVFNFDKSDDIVEKTDDSVKKPDGYVEVIFKTEDETKGKLAGDVTIKTYFVNPTAGINLKVLGKNETATDKQLAVPETIPANNYEFEKWYEDIDQTNSIKSERVHVAKFKLAKVTLKYDAGEGATGTVPEEVKVDHGTKVRLAGPGALTKPNATFAGWKLDGEDKIYQPGEQVKLEKARTATAQWKTNSHTVTFDTKGGSNVPKQEVVNGGQLTTVTQPTLDGKVFMGWKEKGKENDDAYFDLTSTINEDKTLVAIWQDPVQKIGDSDKVEAEFIKVTFKQGDHGTLKDGQDKKDTVTYKVAKDYTFEQAKQAGLVVPGIDPAKYYKAKDANAGWDKALDLTLAAGETEKVFTAQYEPIADVIPIEPGTSDENIEKERPEGMVLVTFKVDPAKAFMTGNTKFYVKENEMVNIDAPVVHPLTLSGLNNDYTFKGWSLNTEDENDKVSFEEDTEIDDMGKEKPDIQIGRPKANSKNILITELTDGAEGYLEISGDGIANNKVIKATKRGRINIFNIYRELGRGLKRGDIIKVYAVKNGVKSEIREYRIR